MDKEDFYTRWKEYRNHAPVPENFASGVMVTIENQVPQEEGELPGGLTDVWNRSMQWSTAAGLLLLGLLRIVFITVSLLRANPLVPY
jgi:hypothetical protein